MTLEDDEKIWDQAYSKTILPWDGIQIIPEIYNYLDNISGIEKILVTGCGTGATAEMIRKKGYHVIGTDLSQIPLNTAKERYPHISFSHLPNERLVEEGFESDATLDWMNMHQVENIEHYLKSLSKTSNHLLLSYLYDPKIKIRNSVVAEKKVWAHNPLIIESILDMEKTLQHDFVVTDHLIYGTSWNAVLLIYRR